MEQTHRSPRNVRFGVFEADMEAGELRKHGLRLKLSEQPFQILAMLVARPGEVVSREVLRERLWPSDTFVDFDHGLNNAVMRLREVLGDSSEHPRFIETLPRRGYRFIAPIEEIHPQGVSGRSSDQVEGQTIAPVAPVEATGTSVPNAKQSMLWANYKNWLTLPRIGLLSLLVLAL